MINMNKSITDLMEKGTHSNVALTWYSHGYCYMKFCFIKTKPNCILIYPAFWDGGEKYLGKITTKRVYINSTRTKELYTLYNIIYKSVVKWSAEESPRLQCRTSYGYKLFTFDGVERGMYSNIVFDHDGNLVSGTPKRSKKVYNEWYKVMRQRNNSASKVRYHNKKAIDRYDKWRISSDNPTPPISDVFKHTNADRRTKLISHYGLDKVLDTLDSKVIDKDTINNNYYELISVKIPETSMEDGWRNGTYLSMINPSTGETHLEGVPNPRDSVSLPHEWTKIKSPTVKAALAWRDDDGQDYEMPMALS